MAFLEEITTNVLWREITLAQLKLYTASPVNMIHSGGNADLLLRDLGRTRCWAKSRREGRKGKEVVKVLLFWHDL